MFVLLLFPSVVYLFYSLSYLYSDLHSFFHVDSAKGNTRCAFGTMRSIAPWRYTILPHLVSPPNVLVVVPFERELGTQQTTLSDVAKGLSWSSRSFQGRSRQREN